MGFNCGLLCVTSENYVPQSSISCGSVSYVACGSELRVEMVAVEEPFPQFVRGFNYFCSRYSFTYACHEVCKALAGACVVESANAVRTKSSRGMKMLLKILFIFHFFRLQYFVVHLIFNIALCLYLAFYFGGGGRAGGLFVCLR